MAKTSAPKEAVTVNGNVNVIEDMLTNLKLDMELRDEQDAIRDKVTETMRSAQARIRNAQQALEFMTDYMTEDQLKQVEEYNLFQFDEEEIQERSRLNEVAQSAYDILQHSKTGEMTNETLYEHYVKSLKQGEEAVKYGEFNIKLRSLFSGNRLLRVVPDDAQNSRSHIIRVKGFNASKK